MGLFSPSQAGQTGDTAARKGGGGTVRGRAATGRWSDEVYCWECERRVVVTTEGGRLLEYVKGTGEAHACHDQS